MSDDQLDELGALIAAAVPAHRPGFWQHLNDRLEGAGEDGGPTSGGKPGQAHDQSPIRKDTIMSLTLPPAPEGTRPPARDELHDRRTERRRWIPLAVAAGIVGIALTATALVDLSGDDAQPAVPTPSSVPSRPAASSSPSPSGPSAGPSISPSAESTKGTRNDQGPDGDKSFGRLYPPTGRQLSPLEQLDPNLALSEFGNAGPLKVEGTPAFAYQWMDKAGDNLMVLSAVRTSSKHDGATFRDSTLYVTTFRMVDAVGDGPVTTKQVRRMVEPGSGPCELGYPDGFLPGATTLSDTDGDGVGEISAGWFFDCRGEIGQDNIRIAVLEGADKYILRGTGYRFEGAREDVGGDPMTRTPDPAASSWPKGLYAHAVKVWDSLVW